MNIRHGLRYSRSRLLCALAGIAGMIVCSSTANAGFADDSTEFAFAISILRSAIGEHPRVLRIEADADGVAIEVQDPRYRNHVDCSPSAIARQIEGFCEGRISGSS